MANFQIRLRNRRDITDAEIIEDMQKTALTLGTATLTSLTYAEVGMFDPKTVGKRFGSWNRGLEIAGLAVSCRQNISNEELFENLASVWTRLGDQPSIRQLSASAYGSTLSGDTYRKRFGSWNRALLAFSDFINSDQNSAVDRTADATSLANIQPSRRRTGRDINWRLRAKILIRDSCICQMCGDSPAKHPDTTLHVDHVIAWANGGETVEENLQTLCAKCNIGKSNAF